MSFRDPRITPVSDVRASAILILVVRFIGNQNHGVGDILRCSSNDTNFLENW